uniref:Uncharacterized protein n=1 Tax=Meloidogyne enterolobii TaxID=390850 RepID=A0A6V7Y1Z8_MELEN|nr:unnamed protein product [Meloidogyne enterolobii]
MDLKGVKEEEGKYNLTDPEQEHPYCVLEGEGFIKPSNWEIIGKNPAPEHDHLLVFYMLPQSASRKHIDGNVNVDPPDGPKCEELYIEFDMQNYTLLSVRDLPTTTTTTTTTTTPPPTTTTSTATTSTPTTVKTTETATTEKPKPQDSLFGPTVIFIGIFVGIIVIVFGGAMVIFLFMKAKKNRAKWEDDDNSKITSEKSKMGEKSKMEEDKAMMEATAKMEEGKSKMGEKSKMATTANSMMETNSKMEEEDKSKSSQQE